MEREKSYPEVERRRRNITDADVQAIADVVAGHLTACRFGDISHEEFMEIVNTHRAVRKAISEGKMTLWKSFLVLAMGLMLTLLTDGFWSRLMARAKQVINPQ